MKGHVGGPMLRHANSTQIVKTVIHGHSCMTTGSLPSGEKFYVYRLLLYADDFNPRSQLFPRGSVGGVYMSPAGFNIRSRRMQASIRTISLTPPGVTTNFILDYIIEDLVE